MAQEHRIRRDVIFSRIAPSAVGRIDFAGGRGGAEHHPNDPGDRQHGRYRGRVVGRRIRQHPQNRELRRELGRRQDCTNHPRIPHGPGECLPGEQDAREQHHAPPIRWQLARADFDRDSQVEQAQQGSQAVRRRYGIGAACPHRRPPRRR